MAVGGRFTAITVLVLSLAALLSTALTPIAAGRMEYRGASTGTDAIDYTLLSELGASHARVYILWKYIEPKLTTLETGLTIAALRADPSLIDQWAKTGPSLLPLQLRRPSSHVVFWVVRIS